MQPTQASSSNSLSRIPIGTQFTKNALPRVVSVSNDDIQSQTITANSASYQEGVVASSSQCLTLLQAIQKNSPLDQEKVKHSSQLEMLLKYMFELSSVPFDDEPKIETNDCSAQYHQLDMVFFSLNAHILWVRAKTIIAKLIFAERKQNVRAIQVEKTWFWKNLADLAKVVVEYKKTQSRLLAHKDGETNASELIKKENFSAKKNTVRKTKLQFCGARRAYLDVMRRYQLEEQVILARLPELLNEDNSLLVFHDVFYFLAMSEIRQLVKSAVVSMPAPEPALAKLRAELEFKHIRDSVTQQFWDSFLPELSMDRFQKKFLQFICSSWKSDLDASRKAAKELKVAHNDTQRCRLFAQAYFREALCTSAINFIHYILQQSRIYKNIQSSGSNKYKLVRNQNEQRNTFQNLRRVFNEAYEKIYLPYVASQRRDWSRLQQGSPSQLLIELKKDIAIVKKNRSSSRKNRDASTIPHHLQLINQVLEQFEKKGCIKFRFINRLIAEEIEQNSILPVAIPPKLAAIDTAFASQQASANSTPPQNTENQIATDMVLDQDNLSAESLNLLYDEVGNEVDLILQDDNFFKVFENSQAIGAGEDSAFPSTFQQKLTLSPLFQVDKSFDFPDTLFEEDVDMADLI